MGASQSTPGDDDTLPPTDQHEADKVFQSDVVIGEKLEIGLVPGDGSDELHRLIARVQRLESAAAAGGGKARVDPATNSKISTGSGVILGDDKKDRNVAVLKPELSKQKDYASEQDLTKPHTSSTGGRARRPRRWHRYLEDAGHQPGTAPKGIHYWSFIVQTRSRASVCQILIAVALSIATIITQLLLLAVVVESSTSQTCDYKTQTGCRDGEYCSVNYAKGQCNDCATVLPSESTCCVDMESVCPAVPVANYTSYFYVYDGGNGKQGCHSTNWQLDECATALSHPARSESTRWSLAFAHLSPALAFSLCRSFHRYGTGGCIGACAMWQRCMDNDKYPQRCDFVVLAADRLKATHAILIIFAAIMSSVTLSQELDDMDTEQAALTARATAGYVQSRLRRCQLRLTFWVYSVLHSSALPGFTSSAIVVAILTDGGGESISAGVGVVYAFMALLFISHLDTTMAELLVPKGERQRCEEIHGAISADLTLPDDLRRPVRWLHNRCVALALAALITLEALNIEDLMTHPLVLAMRVFYEFPGEDGTAQDPETRGAKPGLPLCNQLNQTVAVMALLIGWVLVALRGGFRYVRLMTAAYSLKPDGPGLLPADARRGARALAFLRLLLWPSEAPRTRPNLLHGALSVLRVLAFEPLLVYGFWWVFMVLVNGHLLNANRLFAVLVVV